MPLQVHGLTEVTHVEGESMLAREWTCPACGGSMLVWDGQRDRLSDNGHSENVMPLLQCSGIIIIYRDFCHKK